MICVALKDGKIRIARIGKPFFPEPIDEKIMIIKENQELFIAGPYPEKNTIIMNYEKYKSMVDDLKKHCPRLVYWKISTFVFCVLTVILSGICIVQTKKDKFFFQRWK